MMDPNTHPRLNPHAPTSVRSVLSGSPSTSQQGPRGDLLALNSRPSYSRSESSSVGNGTQWGENFWITIVDPQTQAQFFACPATGEASWEPPIGHFVMPPNEEGEWWELQDESREMPYYYHTKSGETQWTRPEGFVIPLGIIQTTTALGRRFSQNARRSVMDSADSSEARPAYRRYHSQTNSQQPRSPENTSRASRHPEDRRRSISASTPSTALPSRSYITPQTNGLYTIPSEPSSSGKSNHKVTEQYPQKQKSPMPRPSTSSNPNPFQSKPSSNSPRSHPIIEMHSQSLQGAAELITAQQPLERPRSPSVSSSPSDSPSSLKGRKFALSKVLGSGPGSPTAPVPSSPGRRTRGQAANGNSVPKSAETHAVPPSSKRNRDASTTKVSKPSNGSSIEIGHPVLDKASTNRMNPTKTNGDKPVFIPRSRSVRRLSTGDHRTLPRELAQDIQQFVVSDFAKLYFTTHRTGLIFRRRVPVEELMSWQKVPLASPLLVLNRSLHKDAVKIFKVIQRIMGDREANRPVGVHLDTPPGVDYTTRSLANVASGSMSSLEEERWMLSQGVLHGELRDEIYCQTVKQLSVNPNPESEFRGWQLLCVLLVTFPPSKNLEAYTRSFMQGKLSHREGRIDVMAKYCLGRLSVIAKKGPRGKAPSCQEIETASDAAFNPSTFGESLESIFRLQQRTYGDAKVPIILPFLADGIIALGGLATEGTWRISGDGDAVSELKVRIDKGYYNLEGIDDCHVPASLLKLWLRELEEPLIPEQMYNECLACADDPEKVVDIVKHLPTINRRVLLFIISLLQLFLQEQIQSVTKMNSINLALVMAPNLLRCNSDLMSTVFTNTQHEHTFVHNLLVHLKPHRIDPDYVPVHGLGGSAAVSRSEKTH